MKKDFWHYYLLVVTKLTEDFVLLMGYTLILIINGIWFAYTLGQKAREKYDHAVANRRDNDQTDSFVNSFEENE